MPKNKICPICWTTFLDHTICPMCKYQEELFQLIKEIEEAEEEPYWNALYEKKLEEEAELEKKWAEYIKKPHLNVGDVIPFAGKNFNLVKIIYIGVHSYEAKIVDYDGYTKEYVLSSNSVKIRFEDSQIIDIKPILVNQKNL